MDGRINDYYSTDIQMGEKINGYHLESNMEAIK